MKVRVSWTGSELTATIDVETEAEAYGICGEFFFDQGGHGNMGFPAAVENISTAAAILGRKGRAVNSEAQKNAARENGKKNKGKKGQGQKEKA